MPIRVYMKLNKDPISSHTSKGVPTADPQISFLAFGGNRARNGYVFFDKWMRVLEVGGE